MRIKDRLHRAVSFVVLSALAATGLVILALTRASASRSLDKELSQTSFLIYKAVRNVYDLNEKMLLGHLRLLESRIGSVSLDGAATVDSDAEHHITRLTDYVSLPVLSINGRPALGDALLVDSVAELSGGYVSLLQLFPQGLLQVATNIRRPDGRRATQLYYPNDDKITEAIRAGKTYVGKAFEMNEWYIVAYKPLLVDGRPVGAIHVGIKPDIADLRKHILDVSIGRTGRPYIVDTEGILVIAAEGEGENVYHLPHVKRMVQDQTDGTVRYREGGPGRSEAVVVHYRYLPEMEWYVVAGSYEREFYADQEAIAWTVTLAIVIAFGVAVLVSLRVSDRLTKSIGYLTESMNAVKELRFDFGDFAAVDRIKGRLRTFEAVEDEIALMTESFCRMMDELEAARKEIVSKHRRWREMEIGKRVGAMLEADFETLQGYEDAGAGVWPDEAAGQYVDRSAGPEGEAWYLIGEAQARGYAPALAMMMAQAASSSMARAMPESTPEEIAAVAGGYLVDGLEERAGLEGVLALSLVVVRRNGSCLYAGPREGLLVYRSALRACEAIATCLAPAAASDARSVRRLSFRLGRGDVAVFASPEPDREEAGLVARVLAARPGERLESIAAALQAELAAGREAGRERGTLVVLRRNEGR